MKEVVIIGSGLGGLSCGVILVKNGYHVTVLEQGAQAGGCLQCFVRDGAKFETGMHFIGSAAEGQTLNRLLRYLEADVKLSQLDTHHYDVISLNGEHFAFANGRETFIDTLSTAFPDQRENLVRLFDIIERVAKASSLHSLEHTETDDALNTEYQLKSINEVISSVITDEKLQNVLVGNLPLYAAEKDKTPFSVYAFIMDFYNQSAWRIVGGSDQLAKSMIATIERYGGQVLTRKRVTEIVCDEEKATGVTCEDGSSYAADIVISDAHPSVTVELVKSRLFRPAYRKRIQNIPNTIGGFAVYLHFKEDEVAYMNYNFYGYNQSTPWGCENYDAATWPKGYLYMHLCEEEGQKYAKSGVILSYMQMKDVEKWKETKVGRRGKEYEEFKHQHAEKLLDSLEKEFPGLRSHIASYTTSTPLTYLDYTGTPGGSMYGVAKDVHAGAAARVHHRTKIPNLLLTGQNINSHGILGVLVGTMVTCGEVIGSENLFRQIVNHRKSVIIGGGLGGLFTGALLAKEGYQVTVIEKNRVIGGGLQTFSRHGVKFETGMHLLGGIRKDGAIYKICEYLGIMKDLKIHDVDADCMDEITYISDGKTYHIPEGKENFIRYFQSEFPEEKQGIRDYVEELYHIVDEIDFFYLRTENEHIYSHDEKFYWPADKIVEYYLKNPKLRDAISYMNPMFGGSAGHTPGYISALINVLYINGPSRFVSNSQQMAEALARVIEEGGGKIVSGDPVVKVDIEGRQMKSVTTESGQQFSGENYICAIHPKQLLRLTDAKAFSKAYRNRINEAPNSFSSFCVFCIFKPESFPYINHTCYLQMDYGKVWHYGEYDAKDWPRGFMYMTPCEDHQGPYARKMIINSPMPYSVCSKWADSRTGHRSEEYEEWKQEHLDRILDRMEMIYPAFRDKCEYVFASSPLTIRDYYNEPEGALYGLFKDCEHIAESQVPVFTKVRNLFMAGQNCNVHGFCGVPLTAINTVEAIVGINRVTNKINEAYERSK